MKNEEGVEKTISKTTQFFKSYYSNRKLLIDIIGFTGVVASLFLQITQYQTESLRMLQCLLLLIFGLLTGYCIFDFWIKYSKLPSSSSSHDLIGSMILSSGVIIFLGNLLVFINSVFSKELKLIFFYNLMPISALIFFIPKYFVYKSGFKIFTQKRKLILILQDTIGSVLVYIFTLFVLGRYLNVLIIFLYSLLIAILFDLNVIKTSRAYYIFFFTGLPFLILALYLFKLMPIKF